MEESKYKTGNEPRAGNVTTVYRVDAHCSSLCEALYKLVSSEPQFCDVILRLSNNKREFKAHSPVLVTCSAFFKSILTKPENQCAKNVVVLLPDFIRAEGLEPILLFIYTGDLGIHDGNVNCIFQVASLFELPGAISLCHKYVETRKLSLSVLNPDQLDPIDQRSQITDPASEESTNTTTDRDMHSIDSVADKENFTKISSENVVQNPSTETHHNHNHNDDNEDNDEMSAEENSTDEVNSDDNSSFTALRQVRQGGRFSDKKTQNSTTKTNNLPVRRSLRKLAAHKRKVTMSAVALKKYSAKRKRNKMQIHKMTNWSETKNGKTDKIKTEDNNPRPGNSKIDSTLKFTDPAKYISELIDKNSDMLNEHGTDNESGGIKMVTKGKVTIIYPEGHDVVPSNNNNAENQDKNTQQQQEVQTNTKINDAGLPYEKIIDPLMCAECNMSFPSAALREEHMQTKHKGHGAHMKQVMFQCLNCPFSTDFLRNMWFHCHWKHAYPLPDTLRQYCCGLCDYRAPAQGNIEVHIRRVHTHERPLMCDVCGQFFKSLDTLRGHRFYRHQDIYPFQCNVCEKQFKRRHKLDVHMRIHMGYKPFSCPECPYATYTKFNLKDHVRKRHLKELETSR